PELRTESKISGEVRAGYFAMISSTPSCSSTVIGSRRVKRSCCSRSSIWASSTFCSLSCSMAIEVSTRMKERVSSEKKVKMYSATSTTAAMPPYLIQEEFFIKRYSLVVRINVWV